MLLLLVLLLLVLLLLVLLMLVMVVMTGLLLFCCGHSRSVIGCPPWRGQST
jgi:hypothetical protein